MLKQHRWATIVESCQQSGEVSVEMLVEQLGVSEATIRRDLQQMADLRMISRYHGGAKLNSDQTGEPPMLFKSETNIEAKNKVARLAASLIQDNQMVYVDAGSSTYEMLNYITAKNITIITIGIPHIHKLTQNSMRTIVLGGTIRWSTQAITGYQTLKQLDDMYFDVAFIGVNGIHKQLGYTTTNEQEAAVKSKVIEHSNTAYLLADATKFNKLFPAKYASLTDGILLTDEIIDFDKNLLKYIQIGGEHKL